MTLVALLALATGAWADIAQGDVFMFGSYIDFGTSVKCKLYSGGTDNTTVAKSTKLPLTYGGYENGKHQLVFNSANATSYLYIVDTNSAKPWGIKVIGGDGSNDNPFTFSTVYDWPNNCPQELIIGTDGTCSFDMPASDVTIDYELVRDMTIAVSAEMPSRVRIQKDNNVFVAVTASEMLPTVTDGIDEQNPATMTSATDYTLQLQKEGENNSWTDVTELSVGTFRYAVTGVGLYDGVMYTNTFELFQGYEIEVPAGEYVTYYKDENLYEEDPDVKLYTISSVSTTAATLSSEIAIAPASTPILVYNGGQEAKTVLLIPTVDAADNVQAATAFKGTLTATTIPASTSTKSNYALNGKQFVWVKEALPVAANKCWLEIPNSANAAPAMTIVFGEATGIGVIDNGQRTSGDWYDLNGRKLEGRPTKKGVYINNGRKVVIK